MPRINRAIELLAAGQPVYCTSVEELTYERGVDEARTWADYLTIDLEHHPFAPAALLAFMRGLVDGGPTASAVNCALSCSPASNISSRTSNGLPTAKNAAADRFPFPSTKRWRKTLMAWNQWTN